jgi:hypothetical protein
LAGRVSAMSSPGKKDELGETTRRRLPHSKLSDSAHRHHDITLFGQAARCGPVFSECVEGMCCSRRLAMGRRTDTDVCVENTVFRTHCIHCADA